MLYLYKVLEEQKRAKESTKRKLGAPEVQSAPEVMTSSEASSSEARSPKAEDHHKLKNLKIQKVESHLIMPKSC